ncbi:alcohol dehydrogenase catalytic domain-containing protein [Mycobacterium camsae]|uniref:alcohol dehydrogenase catalytic domain-containing protein n=1 Tax=Mycobacterium gordonae TaxID=1778 RepID=UPI00197D0038|nr:alcohol dehydrogenase catalytic domain-containing protein [Mycobacterium gordonae]
MRAVIVDGPRSIRVETRPDPALPGPDGAIVAVTAAGICGSDLHFYDGEIPVPGSVALGHEAVGTVVEVGPDVHSVRVGDRVMVSSVAGCGTCPGCATRDPVTCSAGLRIFGSGVLGGAQADLLAVPAADFQLLKIPAAISTEQAVLLTDNLATGWAAARRADIPFGGTVAVIGLGAVGLCALRCALAQGAATVFAVDRVQGRLQRAAAWGGIPIPSPAAEAIIAATGGRGADSVIDAVGTDASMTDAINAVRTAGTVSVVGLHDLQPFPLPALPCLLRSITLRLTTAPVQRTWPELIPLLASGRLDVEGICTTTMPLAAAAEGYTIAGSRSGDQVKILLTP